MSGVEDELKFVFVETSLSGAGLSAVECKKGYKSSMAVPNTLLPLGMPPVIKSLSEQVEERFLHNLEDESIYSSAVPPRFFQRVVDKSELYSVDLSPLATSIQVERNPTDGKLLGFYEAEETREGDTDRKKITPHDKGKLTEVDKFLEEGFTTPNTMKSDLLWKPPGFNKGMEFNQSAAPNQSSTSFNITDLVFSKDFEEQFGADPEATERDDDGEDGEEMASSTGPTGEDDLDIGNVKSVAVTQQASKPTEVAKKTTSSVLEETWAVEINVSLPVKNFHKLLPNMAHKYPFKLDAFQEHAIMKLEKQESVFVAAHTSAGKTVVAEYAIALTAKHMTRVVYTSPIKALSNQKFRDFKQTFSDVGLITGDVQINPEAFCLIMTTEILRSMLYNGSDVIRDLEWVIFDEVHYINDAERGVVWEEVLIMLPQHCNIILLSATVPNAVEFANWIGRTRQRNIYVITTLKRPVPLEHYLYTGNSTKTSNELFMIVDGDRKFLKQGHKAAVDAKNARASKHSKTFGAKNRTGGGYNADKNVWLSLITKLRKAEQLPVVGFTFSRRRCDENATSLESLDLTSTSEKREIKNFFNKCIQRLKGTDRKLPQVLRMAALLERGLGVHHSGILPILKEVIEMLFSRGLVKLLFATETFAMGVNMPARTVIFDSIRKHDGTQMRNLLPGEYVQMAGRAGRRGLDATGTVILLCKGDVPDMSELHTMMLGRVTKLQSQFRLTYGMILNLLRVEQLRVEEVMKKSFSEFNTRKNSKVQEEELRKLKEELDEQSEIEGLLNNTDYEQYYLCCKDLKSIRCHVMEEITSGNLASKLMSPGRVIVLDLPKYRQHVAVLLKANSTRAEKTFQVLVLLDGARALKDNVETVWSRDYMLKRTLFRPEVPASQDLLEVKSHEISHITIHTMRLHADTIIADCKRRQIPRFRSDPVDQSTSVATQQMLRLVDSNPDGLQEVNLMSELGLKQLELVEDITKIRSLEVSIREVFQCVELPRFNSQMKEVAKYLQLKDKFTNLKYLLSDESLFLLPEYEQRVKVLQRLRYVDDNCAVQMKGRVACEISNHELILTELVFENVLSSLDATEIVALLSCCVFQQNVDMQEVSLTPKLKEGMNRIIDVAEMIGTTQRDCGMLQPVDEFVAILKFGLVEAVYEWSKGTTFKDITNLTEVQEGVIVRTIQRLNELCRDVRNAARVIGDPTLYSKMEKCSELVKRDIVFAASLYTQ